MKAVSGVTRVLGIDPGFGRVGFGIIDVDGSTLTHVVHGCIDTDPNKDFVHRLEEIHLRLNKIIDDFSPDRAAVEELFFVKNVTTGINVGQARGVILLSLVQADLSIAELKPSEIKQAVTGYGNADKQQIQQMVKMMLNMNRLPTPDDAADGLAVAIAGSRS